MNSDERREAVARIVDSDAFMTREQWKARRCPIEGDRLWEELVWTKDGHIKPLVEQALAKADSILALPDPAIAELVEGLEPFAELDDGSPGNGTVQAAMDNADLRRAAQLVAKYRSTP